MIDEAVKTEDYERAASIRDEIDKRKKKRSDLRLYTFDYKHLKINVRSGFKMSVEMFRRRLGCQNNPK